MVFTYHIDRAFVDMIERQLPQRYGDVLVFANQTSFSNMGTPAGGHVYFGDDLENNRLPNVLFIISYAYELLSGPNAPQFL